MKNYFDEVNAKRNAFKEAHDTIEPAAKRNKLDNVVTMDFILKR